MTQKKRPKDIRHFAYIACGVVCILAVCLGIAYSKKDTAPLATALPVVVASRELPDISKTPPAQRAIRDKLIALLKPDDASSVFVVVDTIEADKTLSLNCHEVAHDIGHAAYELYGFTRATQFTDATRLDHASVQDICAGGYMHGVLEEAALHDPAFDTHPGLLCQDISSDIRASCFHGIGHALMFNNFRDATTSISQCRGVGRQSDASRCFEGVWMEFFWGSTAYAGAHSLGWDEAQPLAPCLSVASDAQPACFLYAAFGYLRSHPKEYTGALKMCATATAGSDSEFCIKGVGITMVSHLQGKHFEEAESLVQGYTYWQRRAFYQGMFGYAKLSGIPIETLGQSCRLFAHDADLCDTVIAQDI